MVIQSISVLHLRKYLIERIFYVYNADRFDFNGTADRTWIFDDEAAVYTTTLKNNTNDTPKYQWYKKDDNGNFIPVKRSG